MTKGTLIEKTTYDLGLAIQANLPASRIPLKVQEYFLQHKEKLQKALRHGFFEALPADFLGCKSGFCMADWEELLQQEEGQSVEKFSLLADLGTITVTEMVSLDKFMKENRKKFYSINENITDANFPNPSRILKPGDKLWVRAFQQIVKGSTTSEERMKFLKKQNAIFTGAQGAALVFEQKRDKLPKGKWYASFDEKERLWEDADGDHRVPAVNAYADGDFLWPLGVFEDGWDGSHALLCFCDVPSGT